MYILPINSANFFGLTNNVETLISSSGIESTNPININTIWALSVGIDGDISFNYSNMESNLTNSLCKASDLIFQMGIKGYLLDYQNIDGGDSFHFDLGNKNTIKYFILSVYDQDGNTINDMTDYIIHMQFMINKISQTDILMKSMIDYNKQIYLIVGHIFDLIYKYLTHNI